MISSASSANSTMGCMVSPGPRYFHAFLNFGPRTPTFILKLVANFESPSFIESPNFIYACQKWTDRHTGRFFYYYRIMVTGSKMICYDIWCGLGSHEEAQVGAHSGL